MKYFRGISVPLFNLRWLEEPVLPDDIMADAALKNWLAFANFIREFKDQPDPRFR